MSSIKDEAVHPQIDVDEELFPCFLIWCCSNSHSCITLPAKLCTVPVM